MSDQNGAAATTATGKTFTQEDIERERAHTQHFKQIADELQAKFKGIDPDDYSNTKKELEEIRKKAALGNPEEMEKWKVTTESEIRKQVQKELDEANSRASKYEGENKELRVTDKVFAALGTEIMPDMADFIKEQIRRYGDINEKGEIVFKDGSGKPMYAPGSTTQPMGLDHFKLHLRGQFPSAFKASDKGGTKQPGEKVSVNGITVTSLADLKRLPSAQQREVLSKMSRAEQDALLK